MPESSAGAAPAIVESGWLTLAEAIKESGKSANTIERRRVAGVLESKLMPVPGQKPNRVYSAEGVRRLAEEGRKTPDTQAPAVLRRATPVPQAAPALELAKETRDFVGDIVARLRESRAVDLTDKLWLTVKEASALSGLPSGYVRQLCIDGKLRTLELPYGRGIMRRIHRASLEAFAG